jgi:hypothetical protein
MQKLLMKQKFFNQFYLMNGYSKLRKQVDEQAVKDDERSQSIDEMHAVLEEDDGVQ